MSTTSDSAIANSLDVQGSSSSEGPFSYAPRVENVGTCVFWHANHESRCPCLQDKCASGDMACSLFRRGAEPDSDLDEKILLLEENIARHSSEDPNMPATAHLTYYLGALHHARFQRCDAQTDLDAAIRLYQDAAASSHLDSTLLPYARADLGNTLHLRYRLNTTLENIDCAIKALERARQGCSTGDEELSAYLVDSLACALDDKAILLNHWFHLLPRKNAVYLEDSIALQIALHDLLPQRHPTRARYLRQTVGCMLQLYSVTGETSMLDEAAVLAQEALDLVPSDHEQRAGYLLSLAVILYHREDPDIRPPTANSLPTWDRMLYLVEECLQCLPYGPGHRGDPLTFLGETIKYRQLLKGEDCWDELIDIRKQALAHSLPVQFHQACMALATDLLDMPTSRATNSDIVLAQYYASQALEFMKYGHTVRFSAYGCLSRTYIRQGDIPSAVHHLLLAATDETGNVREQIVTTRKLLHELRPLILEATSPTLHIDSSGKLLDVYRRIARMPPRMAFWAVDIRERLTQLADSWDTTRDGALLALRMGRPELAVQCLEDGRAAFWSHGLRLRHKFDGLPDALAAELMELSRSLEEASFFQARDTSVHKVTAEEAAREALMRRQSARFDELVDKARKLPGFERFMMGLEYSEFSAASRLAKGPVLLLLPGLNDCHALAIMPSGEAIHIPLQTLHPERLATIAEWAKDDCGVYRTHLRQQVESEDRLSIKRNAARSSRSVQLLAELWIKVVEPIIGALKLDKATGRNRARLTWIPTGVFTFVPIHAAGVYTNSGQCCSDYFVSSYAPTVSALLGAQQTVKPIPRNAVKIMLAAAPASHDSSRAWLPFTAEEIRAIQSAVPHEALLPLQPSDDPAQGASCGASVSTVLHNLPQSTIAHLACHGYQDLNNPLESGFLLRDGTLTIAKLMPTSLPHAFLAFLSACETAKGDAGQPDQSIHLAAAMLFAGFRSVIATMWSMGDIDGPLVARIVYEELFRPGDDQDHIDPSIVPYALDAAVTELRRRDANPCRWAQYIHIGV